MKFVSNVVENCYWNSNIVISLTVGAGGGVVWDNILETFSFDHFVVLPSPCKDGDIAFYNKSDLIILIILMWHYLLKQSLMHDNGN